MGNMEKENQVAVSLLNGGALTASLCHLLKDA
jgi:hypothetical protein